MITNEEIKRRMSAKNNMYLPAVKKNDWSGTNM